MELQGLTNAASRASFSTPESSGALNASSTATLASGKCCNDAVCSCGPGKAATPQQGQVQLASSSSSNVQLSTRALQLSQGVTSEEGLATRPSAGFSRLVSNAAVPRTTALALQAYQQASTL